MGRRIRRACAGSLAVRGAARFPTRSPTVSQGSGRPRLPRRRGARDVDLPRAAAAAAAAARGRGRGRQDRGRQGARARGPAASSCGCSATRASTRRRPCTSGTTRASSCTCARSRRAASAIDEDELYSERFLVKRPLLRALAHDGAVPPVLLIDEIDRADDEFEAFLLEILSDWTISVPELGVVRAEVPPVVVLTSNRTRDVHDALKRRCLYHWIAHPDFERELAIVRLRAPEVPELLARDVAAAAEALRGLELYKPPGVAETIDWAEALVDARARPASTRRRSTRRSARSSSTARIRSGCARTVSPSSSARRWRAVPETTDARSRRRSGSRSRSRACCAARASRCRSARRSTFAQALGCVGLADRVRACTGPAGRRSCNRPEDIAAFDRAFAVFWDRRRGGADDESSCRPRRSIIALDVPDADDRRRADGDDGVDAPVVTVRWSPGEILRHRDFALVHARRVRRGPPADGRPAARRARARPSRRRKRVARAHGARPICAAPCGVRCAPAASRSSARSSRRATRTRRARAAARRERLDGAVRACVRPLPARGGRQPHAGRGVRARDPPHAGHARAHVARSRRRGARRRAPGRRLVGRDPAGRGRAPVQRRVGDPGAWPAARSS